MTCPGDCRPRCRECYKRKNRGYYEQNKHLWWKSTYIQRARHYGFDPVVDEFSRADVTRMYGDHCAYCEHGDFEELDHYVPVWEGGQHSIANVRPSCAKCNNRRAKNDD